MFAVEFGIIYIGERMGLVKTSRLAVMQQRAIHLCQGCGVLEAWMKQPMGIAFLKLNDSKVQLTLDKED